MRVTLFPILTMILVVSRRCAGFSPVTRTRSFIQVATRSTTSPLSGLIGDRGQFQRRGFKSSSSLFASLKTAIVGMPNVGKSTLFNALTETQGALAANYPFATIEPNVGIVEVPDMRLSILSDLNKSEKTVPASLEFVDVAGLVKGASDGEGLGNKFLANIRECDAIVHVVRCFVDDNVIHVDGSVDPLRDAEVINLEVRSGGSASRREMCVLGVIPDPLSLFLSLSLSLPPSFSSRTSPRSRRGSKGSRRTRRRIRSRRELWKSSRRPSTSVSRRGGSILTRTRR